MTPSSLVPRRPLPRLITRLVVPTLAIGALGWSDEIAPERTIPVDAHAEAPHVLRHPHARAAVRGNAFPEGVIALTWDDGPDRHTLDLARFLQARRVTGTFFVVREWVDGISAEPGHGSERYETGYAHLPVLGELVGLGHRIGNHTDAHVVVDGVSNATVIEQLGRGQATIDRFLVNELRMFRAPGGYWSDASSAAIDTPAFVSTVGPVRWDVDEKDWEGSLFCRSKRPAIECEPAENAEPTRVRPSVVAARYLATIERYRRGVVLLHDRVGDVGSTYALDVARALVPALEARGYVFAAPVLAFTRFASRSNDGLAFDEGSLRVADIDGDGRADLCGDRDGDVLCAASTPSQESENAMPVTAFGAAMPVAHPPDGGVGTALADVDGDGRADVCFLRDDDVVCATSRSGARAWTTALGAHGDAGATLRLADIDGDGRADACVRDGDGVTCATSDGASFVRARAWLDASTLDPARVELADVDGDGRADACSAGVCALSTGRAFGAPSRWSSARELAGADGARFGDLNGDGRADVCIPTDEGVACALSNGKVFTAPSVWLDARVAAIELADVNGDGRADLCALADGDVRCGLAP